MLQDANWFIEDIAKLSRCTCTHPSISLSTEESNSFRLLLALKGRLECDLLRTSPERSVFRRHVLSLKTIDMHAYFTDLKTLERQVLQFKVSQGVEGYERFKRAVSPNLHYKWMAASTRQFFCQNVDPFPLLRAWTTFDSRYQGPASNEAALWQSYKEDEQSFCEFSYTDLVEEKVVYEWFGDVALADEIIAPRHGPGATYTRTRGESAYFKYLDLTLTPEILTLIKEVLYRDADELFPSGHRSTQVGLGTTVWKQDDEATRTCKLVFVPKTALTRRTISKEPTTLQWLQQAGLWIFEDVFDRKHLPIHLRHAELSRRLALQGSFDGSYATIDLSKASDYVTLSLVTSLFARCEVLHLLLGTRSYYVEYEDGAGNVERLKLRKFAPMGSALCFPVECVVFASICEATIRRETGRPSRQGDFLVYGDDIVVRTEFASSIMERLEQLHFIVNRDKTFTSHDFLFREACGIEAYCGRDITPLRLSRMMPGFPTPSVLFEGGSATIAPEQVIGLCDLVNRLYLSSCFEVRKIILGLLACYKEFPYLYRIDVSDFRRFGSPTVPFIIVDDNTATQYRVRRRFNKRLFRTEVRCLVQKVREPRADSRVDADGVIGLFHWHCQARRSSEAQERHIGGPESQPTMKLSWDWVEVY